jgi:ubiquinone/menaquinone biosynthesis C-methylase UbiE
MTVQKDPEGFERKTLHKYADFVNRRVLEVGCGDGRLTWKYAAAANHVTGMDVELNDLRLANADRPHDLENKVSFSQASARYLPFAGAKFDIAILAWSL